MPSRVYPFVQVEIPFALQVPDGRWMVRERGSTKVRHVIVLATGAGRVRRAPGRRRSVPGEAHAVPITRATIVSVEPLEDDERARAWLDRLDVEQASAESFAALNRLLTAQRIAAADPYLHELAPGQALSIRAGFGAGEQVAEGRWRQARELRQRQRRWRRGRRAAILRSQDRLAHLLAHERDALLCEEVALRARLDLDCGRIAHAAFELERALALALLELDGAPGPGQARRVAELAELHVRAQETVARLLPARPDEQGEGGETATQEAATAELLSLALGRLEAALRARATALASR